MAAPEGIVLDPTSEDASNVQLDLNDNASYFLLEHDYPEPDVRAQYASSADTEGEIPVGVPQHNNRVIPVKLRVVGTTALDLDTKLGYISQKVGKFKREGGTYKRTTPSGLVVVYDCLPESGQITTTFDKKYITRQKAEVGLRFTCKPYGRGTPIDSFLDTFSANNLATNYTGYPVGNWSVANGVLVPAANLNSSFILAGPAASLSDGQITQKFTVGAANTHDLRLILRQIDSNNYVYLRHQGTVLQIQKRDAGVGSQLGTSVGFTTVANTAYWLRFRAEGNKLTAELWTSAPTPTGTPAASTTYTLAGADATKYGIGVFGAVQWNPLSYATDYTFDDFALDPYVYVETTNPILVTPPIYGLKGDVPPLAVLRVNELASLDQWWAIYGNESRYFKPGVPTVLDQFATDTIGSGAYAFDIGAGTLSVSGGQLVPSDTTEKRFYRTDSAAYTDTRSVLKVVTGASVASGVAGEIARHIDANNWLCGRLNFAGAASTLTLQKAVGGTLTTLATSGTFTTTTATSYWVVFTVQGAALKVELFTADPATGAAATQTLSYTLTATEAALFVSGHSGPRMVPAGTDYRYDDFRVFPLQGCTEALIDSESLLTSGYSGVQTTRAGASTGGTVANHVVRHTLATTYAASCSTAPLGHVGSYRVFARLYRPTANTGAVSVAFEWGVGDMLRVTRNDVVAFAANEREGDFTLTDLGRIQIPPVTKGSQQWQGRIVAKSTVLSDVLDIDYLVLVPYAEGSGSASAILNDVAPTVFSARDEFDQTAGNLTGKALPLGGTNWTAAGSVNDFTIDTVGHTAQRTAISDAAGAGRAVIGGPSLTNTVVQADVKISALASGMLYQGVSAWGAGIIAAVAPVSFSGNTANVQVIAGSNTLAGARGFGALVSVAPGTWYTIKLVVLAGGRWFVYFGPQGGPLALVNWGGIPSSVTASGAAGLYDENSTPTAYTRNYDNFSAAAVTPDAAIFSARQLELRYDGFRRQDSSGAIWSDVSDPEGDYPLLVPAGREGRQNRIVIDTCRNDPASMFDPSLSKTQLQVVHTPRYLTVPES